MKSFQWHSDDGEFPKANGYQLALILGRPDAIDGPLLESITKQLPGAKVIGCTAGIFFHGGKLFENGYSVSCLKWDGEVHIEELSLAPEDRKSASEIAAALLEQGTGRR